MNAAPFPAAVALVDCNNFYASCERVFDPRLDGVPVAVLSNNDGCVIARSQEVKDLGIGMGTPAFQLRERFRQHRVRTFSSNYALYGDMSRRVMEVLEALAPAVEIYSIDEAFLDVSHVPPALLPAFGREVQAAVLLWTGIPTGVGIAATKTLAKVANHYAKKHRPATGGVYSMIGAADADAEAVMRWCAVADVWGVGGAHGPRLAAQGIATAADLRDADERQIRKRMTVVGHRTLLELRGVPCIPLELAPAQRKGVTSSRSFGRPVESLDELVEAVAAFVDRASLKLRRAGLVAGVLQVFVRTDRFREDRPQYGNTASVRLPVPTADAAELTGVARSALARIYRPGYSYKKAGVMMVELEDAAGHQTGLFDPLDRERSKRLMAAYDAINGRFGSGTVKLAAQSLERKAWHMRRDRLSPCYTTDWTALPVARA